MTYTPGTNHDEALTSAGRPRPVYEELIEALGSSDLDAISRRTQDYLRQRQVTFRTSTGSRPFHVDPIPRVLEAAEWGGLEQGMRQRSRALNAFIADVYGDQEILRDGVVPRRVLDTAEHYEPRVEGIEVPGGHAPVIGFDLVREGQGRFAVLEENLRTPSGLAYGSAARRAVDAASPFEAPSDRRDVAASFELLATAIRDASPDGGGDPSAALLSDGPFNAAWFEHTELARRLGIPIVTREELDSRNGRLHAVQPHGPPRELQVIYRRTDEDRLSDESGRPTWIAEALLEPVRSGRLTVVNGLGAGIADDKLTHAYVHEMIRFYLDEEPDLASVPTYDLGDPEVREDVLSRLDEVVVKPRAGLGGTGVMIGRQSSDEDREQVSRLIRARPDGFVAQETIPLSSHPTVCDGSLEPRHVDLRAFAIGGGVAPGALTRVALTQGSLLVNTSQDGGGKDTWVLA
ncbi:MAG: hypothetical protein QOD14_382 [Solirubrobacterales bacterium]|nr:hypothetical protein [Solirubrobacterales bacterium]